MDGMLSGDEIMNMGIASIHQAALMVTTANCLSFDLLFVIYNSVYFQNPLLRPDPEFHIRSATPLCHP